MRYELPEGYHYGVTYHRCRCHRCGGSDNTDNTEIYCGDKLIGHFVYCYACGNIRHPEYVVERWRRWKKTTLTEVVPSRYTSAAPTARKSRRAKDHSMRPCNIEDNTQNPWKISPEILRLYNVSLNNGVWTFPLFKATGEYGGDYTRKYVPATNERIDGTFLNEGFSLNELMFGQTTAKSINRGVLVFCEGVTDALAAKQMAGSKANSYTFVGAPNANVMAKVIANSWEWASKFKAVLYCPDNDDAGRRAAEAIKALNLPKLKQLVLPPSVKDIRQLYEEGRESVFLDALYAASTNTVECAMSVSEMVSAVRKQRGTPYRTGIPQLDELLKGGLYPHELSVWLAGSGSGKSTFGRYLLSRQENGAYLPFEESANLAFRKYYLQCFRSTPNNLESEVLEIAQRTTVVRTDKIQLDNNTVEEWLRWFGAFVVSSGRNFFLIDHITSIAQMLRGDTERERLQQLMTGLAELVKRYPIHIAVLSQINRVSIESDGNGVDKPVTLTSGFGASALEQYAFVVCGIDGRDEHTHIRVLKDRNGGRADRDGRVYITVPYADGLYGGDKIVVTKNEQTRENEISELTDNIQEPEVRQHPGEGAVPEVREVSDAVESAPESVQVHGSETALSHSGLQDTSVLHRDERSSNRRVRPNNRDAYISIWERDYSNIQARIFEPDDKGRPTLVQCFSMGPSAWAGMDIGPRPDTRTLAGGGKGDTAPTAKTGPDNNACENENRRTVPAVFAKARNRTNDSRFTEGAKRPETSEKEKEKPRLVQVLRANVERNQTSPDGGRMEKLSVHSLRERWRGKRQ